MGRGVGAPRQPAACWEPGGAAGVGGGVTKLGDLVGLTLVRITHDLDLLWQVAERVAVLGEGRVQGIGSMTELSQMEQPAVQQLFTGPRGRAAAPSPKGKP